MVRPWPLVAQGQQGQPLAKAEPSVLMHYHEHTHTQMALAC